MIDNYLSNSSISQAFSRKIVRRVSTMRQIEEDNVPSVIDHDNYYADAAVVGKSAIVMERLGNDLHLYFLHNSNVLWWIHYALKYNL